MCAKGARKRAACVIFNTTSNTLPRCVWFCHKVRSHHQCKTCLRCSLSSRSVRLCSQAQSHKPHELSFDWIRTFSQCMFILLLCTSCGWTTFAMLTPWHAIATRTNLIWGIDSRTRMASIQHIFLSLARAMKMRMLSAPLFDAHLTTSTSYNVKTCRYHWHTTILAAILEPRKCITRMRNTLYKTYKGMNKLVAKTTLLISKARTSVSPPKEWENPYLK